MGRYRETLFMCKYKTAKDTFGDLSAVNLARLMFIATFLGDDGYLIKSTYNSTTKKSGFRSITWAELRKEMKLNDTTIDTTLTELTKKKYLVRKDDKIYLNEDYFPLRKNIDKIIKSKENDVIIFQFSKSVIKNLILNNPSCKHEIIGRIFRLLSYVNRYNYYVCKNPNEQYLNNLQFMTGKDIFDILQYDGYMKNQTKYWNKINCFKIESKVISAQEIIIPEVKGDLNQNKTIYKLNELFGKIIFKSNITSGEIRVEQYLSAHNIKYISQYIFDDCTYKGHLRFDFYLPEYNTCIEYQGQQHYVPVKFRGCTKEQAVESYNNSVKRDKIKESYCQDNNIKLILVPYWEYDTITKFLDDNLNESKKI